MDLDELKESWQNIDTPPITDETKIQHIINHRGLSAFNSLLRTEKVFIILLILCVFISFTLKDQLCFIVYIISVFIAIGWQVYKYGLLKKLQFARMSLLEVAAKISTYKKYIYYEIIVGGIWGIGFVLLWITRVVAYDFVRCSSNQSINVASFIFIFLAIVVFIALWMLVLYKFLYMNKIRIIKEAIREAEEVADFQSKE